MDTEILDRDVPRLIVARKASGDNGSHPMGRGGIGSFSHTASLERH